MSSMAYYQMQNNVVPKGIINEIEKLERAFIWGSKCDKRKMHLVN